MNRIFKQLIWRNVKIPRKEAWVFKEKKMVRGPKKEIWGWRIGTLAEIDNGEDTLVRILAYQNKDYTICQYIRGEFDDNEMSIWESMEDFKLPDKVFDHMGKKMELELVPGKFYGYMPKEYLIKIADPCSIKLTVKIPKINEEGE